MTTFATITQSDLVVVLIVLAIIAVVIWIIQHLRRVLAKVRTVHA